MVTALRFPPGTFGGPFAFMIRRTSLFVFPALTLAVACGRPEPTNDPGPVGGDTLADDELHAIEQRILADPRNAALYAERARWYALHGRAPDAIDDLKRALALDSTNASYRVEIGGLYYQRLDLKEAQDQFDLALKMAPDNTAAMLKSAEIQMVLRQYKRSMDLVNQALRADPNLAQAYFLKGWIHMETGDTALAISSFRTCVEQDPSHYKGFMQLGVLHARRHDPLALEYYDTAIELRPGEVEAWYNKGMYAQENGMDSLALACYDRMKVLDPANAMAWYNSGYVRLEHLNDPRAAIGEFSKAATLQAGSFKAFFNRGLAYEREGVLDSAAMDYQEALRIKPDYDLAARGLERLEMMGLRIVRPQ